MRCHTLVDGVLGEVAYFGFLEGLQPADRY